MALKRIKSILCLVLCMGLLGCNSKELNEADNSGSSSETVSEKQKTADCDAETEVSPQKQEERKEMQILWEVPVEVLEAEKTERNDWDAYYTQNQGGIVYYGQYGEWKWPLGLYSFAVGEELLFVDDSASRRVAILQKGKENQYIPIPENHVCYIMRYDDSSGMLYLLLQDITAVEGPGYVYCRYHPAKGEELETLELIPYATYDHALSEKGEVYLQPQEYAHLEYSELLQERLKQMVGLDKESRGTIDYLSQYGENALYAYYEMEGNHMYLFVVQGEDVITYTNAIVRSEINQPHSSYGYLYEENGELRIAYMVLTKEGNLQVVQVK